MTQATRYFIQTKPEMRDDSRPPEGVIEDFFEHHIFVVLGQPGLGKTTSFQYAAKKEVSAEYVRIGEFLSALKIDHLKGKTLYLDGLPVEIKRDDHKKIWEAAKDQLLTLYSRDPASEGNGVYLVFWLDGKGMKKPPNGIKKPTTASELADALRSTVPETSRGLIDVIVIDAAVPEDKQESVKSKKQVKSKSSVSAAN